MMATQRELVMETLTEMVFRASTSSRPLSTLAEKLVEAFLIENDIDMCDVIDAYLEKNGYDQ